MSNVARTILGFVIAPLVPGALLAAALYASGDASSALTAANASAMFGYPIALLLGLPTHVALTNNKMTSWWVYLASGALLGAFVYVGLPMLIETLMLLQGLDASGHITFSISVLPAVAICTAVSAISFWLIVRPDHAR